MKLDIQKLDDHIQKLQEIRRIIADPEMLSLLLQFILPENEASAALHTPARDVERDGARPQQDDIEGLVKNELLKSAASATPQAGTGVWGVRRG